MISQMLCESLDFLGEGMIALGDDLRDVARQGEKIRRSCMPP